MEESGGSRIGAREQWSCDAARWQPWQTTRRTLELEWTSRVSPSWAKMARLLYSHVNQLSNVGCPGKGHDLGRRHSLQLRQSLKGLTAEACLKHSQQLGQPILHWRGVWAVHNSIYHSEWLVPLGSIHFTTWKSHKYLKYKFSITFIFSPVFYFLVNVSITKSASPVQNLDTIFESLFFPNHSSITNLQQFHLQLPSIQSSKYMTNPNISFSFSCQNPGPNHCHLSIGPLQEPPH